MKIQFDYRFDTNGFFNNAERKAALEYAGNIWSNLLQDDFETIPVGAEFTTINPANGNSETIVLEQEIDDLLIFVGGGNLAAGNNNSASLHTNHFHLSACSCSGCCNSKTHQESEVVNLSQPGILEAENFLNTDRLLAQALVTGTDLQGDIFQRRVSGNFRNNGVVTDFEPWAGTISFNNDNNINWNFDLENTDNSTIDFISVALHEIGHILGIGVAPIFDFLGTGATFKGVNSLAINNGEAIPLLEDLSHVAEGFSGNSVLFDPLLNENRNLPSDFDLALLADIGYEIDGFTKQGFTPDLASNQGEDIIGSNLNDVIDGLAGNDQIQGNEGNDTLNGGMGNDSLFGNAGNDSLSGNEGIDSMSGGLGKDTLDGGADNDLLVGAEDNDFLMGRDGGDEIQGNEGDDILQGGTGNDSLFGQENDDFLLGNEGEDQLQGGEGNDSLQGNEGSDTVFGEAGNDVLDGGTGDDTLVGGAGSDRFFFDSNYGNDTITDFTVNQDIIEVAADLGFSNGNELLAAITQTAEVANSNNSFSQITLSTGNTIGIFHDRDLVASSFEIVTESSIGNTALNITEFTPTNSGFTIKFDAPLNISVLDLQDFSLQQNSTGEEVTGSLVWNQSSLELSFVQSGAVLSSDRYNLTLISNENSFVAQTGELLDGNGDSFPGGNFTTEFTINHDNQRVLSLEDFYAPKTFAPNVAIALNNGNNVTKAEFTVTYNPDILEISDIVVNSQLPDDWTITSEDLTNPGIAMITVEGTTALNPGEIDLVQLQGSIPDNTSYGVSDLITIEDVSLNGGNISAIGDTAIQTVALLGDANGDGSYSDLDSYLISQMAVGLSHSFDAYPLNDSLLIADVNQDGVISAMDSFLVAQRVN